MKEPTQQDKMLDAFERSTNNLIRRHAGTKGQSVRDVLKSIVGPQLEVIEKLAKDDFR